MRKRVRFLSAMLCVMLGLSGCGGGGDNDPKETEPTDKSLNEPTKEAEVSATPEPTKQEEEVPKGEPTVIRWGHNWISEMDTNYRDPVTGEPSMGQEELNARLYAEQQVLEKYNAKIEFVQYPSDVTEIVLQTVLANDPIADVVRITNNNQGQLLAQNVLQPLDEYAYLFEDEDDKWIFWGEVYGHNYFLNNVMRFGNNDLLCYNIGMLNRVEALKVDGKTKYPADYFVEGTWTWSVFEDYLQKVKDHYVLEWDGNHAYQTDYRAAALQAIYSNGGEVYGDNGIGIASDQTKEAVSFIDRLVQKGLLFSENQYNGDAEIVGLMDTWRFQWGHTIFTNLPQWLSRDMVNEFANRGDAMGVVPFPRPDGVAFDDPSYRQLNDATDCYGIPRGLSKERTELVVKVFKEYTQSYYKKMAGSDKAMDYLHSEASARNAAVRLNLDITNEEYGENLFAAFRYLTEGENAMVNDYSKNAGIYDLWSKEILGYSLYGIAGAPKYSVQVEAKLGQINDIMNNYTSILSGTQINDNIKPKFEAIEGKKFIFEAGTDPASINWGEFMKASDNIDGELSMENATVDYSEIDFNTVGQYDGKLHYTIQDSSENVGTDDKTVIIYDGTNTTPPTLVVKASDQYRELKLNEDSAKVNWKEEFVESAVDKDGLDIRENVKADLSELDTMTPGEYNVEISVKDYAGNEAKETIVVKVVKE